MTEEIFKDLCLCGETTKVQFKQAFTSQREIAKEMIAFANSKGGVILFGVEDKTGNLLGCLMNRSNRRAVNSVMPQMNRFDRQYI